MLDVITLTLGPLQTNCYIIACTRTRDAAVIDPAWDGSAIYAQIEKFKLGLGAIILTHAHFDHVGGLGDLHRLQPAPILVHDGAKDMLAQSRRNAARWGIEIPEAPVPNETLADGQTLSVGTLALSVLYTPGHAPGHISLYIAGEGVLISGDALFRESIGRTDLPGGSYPALMDSIHTRLLTLPDATIVYPGHGPSTTIDHEKQFNPFLQS